MEHRLLLTTDVRAYATLAVRLAEPDADRETLLAERGLTEDEWEEIDDAWQARLSDAVDATGDADAVPLLVQEHSEAFAEAQAGRTSAGAPLDLERFIAITLDIQRSHEVQHSLKRNGTTLHDYLRAEKHWLKRMMDEPALQARFHEAMHRKR